MLLHARLATSQRTTWQIASLSRYRSCTRHSRATNQASPVDIQLERVALPSFIRRYGHCGRRARDSDCLTKLDESVTRHATSNNKFRLVNIHGLERRSNDRE